MKKQTGLLGRWEIISESPLVICDVAHNEAGLKAVFEQVHSIPHKKLRIVYGMVKDKDIEKALALLPKEAEYYFTQPQLPRALDYQSLFDLSIERDLKGQAFPDIAMACKQALAGTSEDDIVLVAGSIFVVAEALEYFGK